MTPGRSFRSRLFVGSALWTLGVLLVVSVLLIAFLSLHPRPHAVILAGFLLLPAAVPLLAGLALMFAGAQQIRRGLSAVDQLRTHLLAVQRGEAPRLAGDYPLEIQPLVDDLNGLLADREQRIARALATAGDLAHGLKTPLAVLALDAERAAAGDAELPGLASSMSDQVARMRRQVEYQLAGARASALAHTPGVSCQLAPSVDGLLRAVARLHTERGLHVTNGIADEPTVRCSREDVEEMLGNLLDNACKWGRGQVRVTSQVEGAHVVIAVEDDGPGLDPSLTEAVLGRGVRADERVPGSGLGLAIVRQLAELYGGSIGLSRSTLGGVCARLALPKA